MRVMMSQPVLRPNPTGRILSRLSKSKMNKDYYAHTSDVNQAARYHSAEIIPGYY